MDYPRARGGRHGIGVCRAQGRKPGWQRRTGWGTGRRFGAREGGRSSCGTTDARATYPRLHFTRLACIPALQVILLLQTNVTARVELENRLADLTDAQLGMLEQLFPRHVIEYMLSHKHGYNSRNLTHLANHHDDVIVLFTDGEALPGAMVASMFVLIGACNYGSVGAATCFVRVANVMQTFVLQWWALRR